MCFSCRQRVNVRGGACWLGGRAHEKGEGSRQPRSRLPLLLSISAHDTLSRRAMLPAATLILATAAAAVAAPPSDPPPKYNRPLPPTDSLVGGSEQLVFSGWEEVRWHKTNKCLTAPDKPYEGAPLFLYGPLGSRRVLTIDPQGRMHRRPQPAVDWPGRSDIRQHRRPQRGEAVEPRVVDCRRPRWVPPAPACARPGRLPRGSRAA